MPPRSKQQNKRPTHFVCLPLVTDESIPQLSQSLAYFRSITTPLNDDAVDTESDSQTPQPPAISDSGEAARVQEKPAAPGDDEARRSDSTKAESFRNLRLVPPAAHRPPGTFHLTLGVMDLSDAEDFNKAIRLLQEIDYEELLREAGRGPRERRDESGRRNNGQKAETKVAKNVREERGDESESERSETETKGTLKDIAEAVLSRPLKSLTRAISPPDGSRNGDAQSGSENQKRPSEPREPLSLTLHGLGTFPRPSSSRVFYASPYEPTSRLQDFAVAIHKRFRDAGLIRDARQPLVLHATVANLIYVKGRGGVKGTRYGGKGKVHEEKLEGHVDAREILRFFNQGYATSPIPVLDPVDENESRQEDIELAAEMKTPIRKDAFIWARNIPVDRIRICKMGAEICDIEGWGLEYPAVAEKVFGR
ncbi:uncharacterized protein Z518_09060 [Rhinocladiella mackenziei CBS 650.93]|uniref:A-kinase anchor protein 7-like phosphoesterase domain-containing protein n=1 Tax=Rhinocladiella mackenziei CBS 650.93 TaxID=1442369 RepID=A0A0D2IXL3_9EURO|nr:uncharacterized protein Z518_09060 [Rhinocladiella mackenziei CBS 650.93]KIX01335.1 hypothetical protein Z518_09060 [Rhinocladiella mackenziei CBS 650.93]